MGDAEFETVKDRFLPGDFWNCTFKLASGKLAILVRISTVDIGDPDVELEKGWSKGVNKIWKLAFNGRDEDDDYEYEGEGEGEGEGEPESESEVKTEVAEALENLKLEDWKQEPLSFEGVTWLHQKPLAVTEEISKEVLEGKVGLL